MTVSPTVFAPSTACLPTVLTTRFTRVTGETPRFFELPDVDLVRDDERPDVPPRDERLRAPPPRADVPREDEDLPDDDRLAEPRPPSEDLPPPDDFPRVEPDLPPDFPPERALRDDFFVAAMVFS